VKSDFNNRQNHANGEKHESHDIEGIFVPRRSVGGLFVLLSQICHPRNPRPLQPASNDAQSPTTAKHLKRSLFFGGFRRSLLSAAAAPVRFGEGRLAEAEERL
jgi:hypothetical protein